MSLGSGVGLAIFFLLVSHSASAEEVINTQNVPKVVAVQKRPYFLNDEITIQAGYLPLDAFTKYYVVGATFTHYFSDFMGWEILNVNYASSVATGLEQELVTQYGAVPQDEFDILNYYGTSNFVFTPFYNKNLIFDKTIAYGETSLVGGLGISKFSAAGFVNTVNMGIIFKFVMGPSSSLKFDFRNYINFSSTVRNNLMLMAGFAYNLGEKKEVSTAPDED